MERYCNVLSRFIFLLACPGSILPGQALLESEVSVMVGRKKADVGKEETAAEKSVRLAQQRMGNALKYIGLVGNLAGPGYEFTDGQREQILTAMQEAVDKVKDRFGGKSPTAAGFRLL